MSISQIDIQEAGRGGRDRKDADAILLWNSEDSKRFDQFPENSRQRMIKKFALTQTCRRQVLLDALGGEQAVCSGCDVCNSLRNGQRLERIDEAYDAVTAIKFIKRHQKEFSMGALLPLIKKKFNQKDVKFFGYNVWTENDVKEIVKQLEDGNKISKGKGLWKDKIYVTKNA